MDKAIKAAAMLMLLCLMFGCSAAQVESISFQTDVIEMDVGSARNLKARVSPEKMKSRVSYHSSDEEIASYENGLIIAGKVGTCTLYATVGNKTSESVKLIVWDYRSKAAELKNRINKYYKSGKMTRDYAIALSKEYDSLPDYIKDIVVNEYILQAYENYNGTELVFITESGESYHSSGCGSLGNSGFAVPAIIAELENLKPCKNCRPKL